MAVQWADEKEEGLEGELGPGLVQQPWARAHLGAFYRRQVRRSHIRTNAILVLPHEAMATLVTRVAYAVPRRE